MKSTAVLALVAAATVVSAETNAQRFARGLPPKVPGRRSTPVQHAGRSTPSGSPGGGSCNTGPIQCCQSVDTAGSNDSLDSLLSLLGVSVPIGTAVGQNCSPISLLGSGTDCSQQPVCCDDNEWNGLINIGCSPINIGL